MVDHTFTFQLHRAKIIASGCVKKIESIEEIKNSWDFDNDAAQATFESLIIDIGLQCEYATANFDEISHRAERLLRGPPPYEADPDDRRHSLEELQVLSDLAHDHAENLRQQVADLREDALGTEMRLTEAERRAFTVETDADKLIQLTDQLRKENDGNAGNAAG